MLRLLIVFIYLPLIFLTACDKKEDYQSRANEVFPPVPIKYAALNRVGNLPVIPSFFEGQWTVVIFGKSTCDYSCLARLEIVNNVDEAKKLFVIEDLASHQQLKALSSQFPQVAVTMGGTASSFDRFYAQFDIVEISAEYKHNQVYLVNPSAELIYSLPQQGLTAADLTRELSLVKG